jgi:uncharacterized repeat protein (TIGR01451 family)
VRSTTGTRLWWAWALAILILTAVPASALAASGISFSRSPAPPQAILQSGTQQLAYTVSFTTTPSSLRLSIFNPGGTQIVAEPIAISGTSPAQGELFFVPNNFSLGGSAPIGRYRAQIDFFSRPTPDANPEATANVAFDVADALGTLTIVKFDDLNGNGVRDPGEPGLPGWVFQLVNPQGNPAVVTTGPDGSVTIPSVPAGEWQVTEVMEPGWVPITPVSGPVTIPANSTGVFAAANARPAPICGVVFLDVNRNGILDPGEAGYGNATLTLTGGNGALPGPVVSGPAGDYCFENLLPGTYAVAVTVPAGLVNTSPVSIPNIQLRSGVGSFNNNFGLASPPTTIQGEPEPSPDVRITKSGPATAEREGIYDYSIVVRNSSDFTARDVEVTDLVPVELTLVAIPRGATIRNGVVTWPLGNLAPRASRTLSMRVRVNPQFTGTITNTATVTAIGMRPRRDTARTRVVGPEPVVQTGGVTG